MGMLREMEDFDFSGNPARRLESRDKTITTWQLPAICMVCWALSTQKISGATPISLRKPHGVIGPSGQERLAVQSRIFVKLMFQKVKYALFDSGYHNLFLGVSWPVNVRVMEAYHQIIAWLSSCLVHPLHRR
jgi:hypothetical protein